MPLAGAGVRAAASSIAAVNTRKWLVEVRRPVLGSSALRGVGALRGVPQQAPASLHCASCAAERAAAPRARSLTVLHTMPRKSERTGAAAFSSKAWMRRHVRDPYVKKSNQLGYRSRAALKLAQLDDRYRILRRGARVVDLGCAPGGWLQVAVQRLALPPTAAVALERRRDALLVEWERKAAGKASRDRPAHSSPSGAVSVFSLHRTEVLAGPAGEVVGSDTKRSTAKSGTNASPDDAAGAVGRGGCVVGVDIDDMVPVPGSAFVHGDMRSERIRDVVARLLPRNRADVVLSDMAHSFTGHASLDHIRQTELASSAVDFACKVLARGGSVLVKVRQGEGADELEARLSKRFRGVRRVKPDASRQESAEFYLLARGFRR